MRRPRSNARRAATRPRSSPRGRGKEPGAWTSCSACSRRQARCVPPSRAASSASGSSAAWAAVCFLRHIGETSRRGRLSGSLARPSGAPDPQGLGDLACHIERRGEGPATDPRAPCPERWLSAAFGERSGARRAPQRGARLPTRGSAWRN